MKLKFFLTLAFVTSVVSSSISRAADAQINSWFTDNSGKYASPQRMADKKIRSAFGSESFREITSRGRMARSL